MKDARMASSTFSSKANIDNSTILVPSVSPQSQLIIYIFLLLDIPAVLCSFFLFYCFARLPELRERHHPNQIIIYLLISTFLVNSFDIPLILPCLQNYYYIEFMRYPISFCIFWTMYDYGMYSINLWLMALLCFERYLLIFHKQSVMKNWKRYFFLYYAPAPLIVLFGVFWYLYLVALYPCEQTQFDFTQTVCGLPCYKFAASVILLDIDWALAVLIPVFLAILFIFILIVHVLHQKRKMNKHLIRQDMWKRTCRMFLQLLPIALIFLCFNMPLITVGLLAVSDPWYYTTSYFYANYLTYGLVFFMPFALLSKQIVIKKRLFNLFRLRQPNRTTPINTNALIMRQLTRRTVANTVRTDDV